MIKPAFSKDGETHERWHISNDIECSAIMWQGNLEISKAGGRGYLTAGVSGGAAGGSLFSTWPPRLKFSVLLESLRCSKAHGSAGGAGENMVYDSEIPRREGTMPGGPHAEWGVPRVRNKAGGEWELWAGDCTVVSMGRAGQAGSGFASLNDRSGL